GLARCCILSSVMVYMWWRPASRDSDKRRQLSLPTPANTNPTACYFQKARPEEDRDHPLVLRYNVEPDWLKPLGLPPASPKHERVRAQIAGIALDKARHSQPWISYSRNKNHYSRRGDRYDEQPDFYRYATIPPAVDALAAAGLIESVKAPPNPR